MYVALGNTCCCWCRLFIPGGSSWMVSSTNGLRGLCSHRARGATGLRMVGFDILPILLGPG